MQRYLLAKMATILASCLFSGSWALAQGSDPISGIRETLTLSATFESGPDADFAKGDKRIFAASSAERKDSKPGLPAGEFEIAKGEGRQGGSALRFVKKSNKVVFYQAAGNVDYQKSDWSGTASFWLNLDPQTDLGDWYCDPIQITEKGWNDAAIWVDFTKNERPKHFRLGVLADLKAWNPKGNLDFDKLPPGEQPAVVVTKPPFSRGKWTHVAIVFEHYNTATPNGISKLYLDGKLQGSVSARNQQYTWNPEKAAIQIGMGYVGLFDDLAIFNKALSEAEITTLFTHKGPLKDSR